MALRTSAVIEAESNQDGRVRRGERNRERIVEALFELVQEGTPLPTAEQVAERAGVGTRTVFRHFDDVEGLFAEMSARLEREVRPALEEKVEGSLEERARALVRRRAAIFERIAPFKRSGNLQRWRSPFLRRGHADMVREQRANLREALPELESASPPLAEALELVTSFEAWDRLRSDQRLGRERALAAMQHAVLALVDSLE